MDKKLTPQDKQEIQKLMQNTDDAEAIAAVVTAKSNQGKKMNGFMEMQDGRFHQMWQPRFDVDGEKGLGANEVDMSYKVVIFTKIWY